MHKITFFKYCNSKVKSYYPKIKNFLCVVVELGKIGSSDYTNNPFNNLIQKQQNCMGKSFRILRYSVVFICI